MNINHKKYNAVLFDFDYTLADSSKGIYESVKFALEKMGYICPEFETVCKTIGLHLNQTFIELTWNENITDAVDFLKYFRERADVVMADNTFIFEEVEPVFEYFALKKIKCGIVSTKYRYRIEDILLRDGLDKYIDVIIGGEDVKNPKPDPEGLLLAISSLGSNNRDSLYIGDSLVDAKTAKKAGVDFVGVLTGTTQREEFEEYEPVFIIEKLDELKEIF